MLPNKLSDRLQLMHWTLPVAIALVTTFYQIVPARYVHEHHGDWAHYDMEVFRSAVMALIIVWFVLGIVRPWAEQKDQAEAKAGLMQAFGIAGLDFDLITGSSTGATRVL